MNRPLGRIQTPYPRADWTRPELRGRASAGEFLRRERLFAIRAFNTRKIPIDMAFERWSYSTLKSTIFSCNLARFPQCGVVARFTVQ